jgi:hypothetical protein
MSKQDYDRVALLKEMASSFNASELSELAFNLNIDYEDLAGSNRRAKVRELITHCERRGQVDKLLAALSKMRDSTNWYAIVALAPPGEEAGESPLVVGRPGEDSTTISPNESSPVFVTKTSAKDSAPGDFAGKLKVFLSYASEDRPTIRQLYDQLLADGFDPWLDAIKLLPGMKWNEEIEIAVEESHVVVVCLSNASVSKEGYVQKEIGAVLDQASRMTAGTIFLIPARLQECPLPRLLRDYQAVDLYVPGGYDRLKQSLQRRQQQLASRG